MITSDEYLERISGSGRKFCWWLAGLIIVIILMVPESLNVVWEGRGTEIKEILSDLPRVRINMR